MNQSKKKQTRDGSLTKGMPCSHIKEKKYEFLNLFGIDEKPVLLYVLGKLMNWVITNHIYKIHLANLFLKLVTITTKSKVDF